MENKSTIIAAATSSSAIRGGSYNIIFLDEFAFVPANIAEQFFSSVYPTISSGSSTKMIIVSTPHGMNMYYKLWTDAENKQNQEQDENKDIESKEKNQKKIEVTDEKKNRLIDEENFTISFMESKIEPKIFTILDNLTKTYAKIKQEI